jgi:hypothetical protein
MIGHGRIAPVIHALVAVRAKAWVPGTSAFAGHNNV